MTTSVAKNQMTLTPLVVIANSLWHDANEVRIFIEDQPLYRGGIGGQVLPSMLDYSDESVKSRRWRDGAKRRLAGDTAWRVAA